MNGLWKKFDELFKTVNRQEKRFEELEQRIANLERRLDKSNVIEFKPVGSGAELKRESVSL